MRKIKILLVVFFVLALSLTAVKAQSEDLLTLNRSIEIALERNVFVDSASEEVSASEAMQKSAFSEFLPALRTYYHYKRLNQAPENTVMGTRVKTGTRDNYTWGLELKQPLFAGGRIAGNYDIGKLEAKIAKAEEKTTIQDIVGQVREAYFTILKTERILDVARQSVDQLNAHRDIAQSYYEVGITPRNDLLYAEVELANGQQEFLRAENNVEIAKALFNTILRRDVNMPVEVEDILSYAPYEKSLGDCYELAFRRRPEIMSYSLRIQQADKAVAVTRSDFFPSVSLAANYARYGDTPKVRGSEYQEEEEWYVMAVADWNFWEWGRTKYQVDSAISRKKQALNALVNLKDQISLEVKNAYLLLREAEKHIFVAQKAIEQAEENFRISSERYKEQVATSTDVIDAQTLLSKTKSDYYNALSDYAIAQGRLERSMGILYQGEGKS